MIAVMARATAKRLAAKGSAPKSSSRRVRQRRDFEALRQRRRKAAKLFAKGVPQAEVARRVNASRQSVSRWHQLWSEHGEQALVDAGRAGRPPRLTEEQKTAVDAELRKGPGAHGYATELWTLARVAEVIERSTGVRYHPGHVWRLLRELGWSRQRPARRAVERDEDAIARWIKQDWPRVKKARGAAAPGSSSKTNPAFR
jgi:transposase